MYSLCFHLRMHSDVFLQGMYKRVGNLVVCWTSLSPTEVTKESVAAMEIGIINNFFIRGKDRQSDIC